MDELNRIAFEKTGQYWQNINSGPGDLKFIDLNGDGRISTDDMTIIGNPWPKYQYGLNIQIEYKSFDLSVAMVGIAGRDVMNEGKIFEQSLQQDDTSTPGIFGASFFLGNGITNQPRLGFFNDAGVYIKDPNRNYSYYSDYFVEDGSYMKVKDITLGYTLPPSIVNRLKLEKFRIYFTGQNLLTFTKFSGLDPEFSNGVKNYGEYNFQDFPQTRLFSFGVELSF